MQNNNNSLQENLTNIIEGNTGENTKQQDLIFNEE
jgi:hypothetical protein